MYRIYSYDIFMGEYPTEEETQMWLINNDECDECIIVKPNGEKYLWFK